MLSQRTFDLIRVTAAREELRANWERLRRGEAPLAIAPFE
jgi:hypothetical protein